MLPITILRPKLLVIKNDIFHRSRRRFLLREIFLFLSLSLLVTLIFNGSTYFISELEHHPRFRPELLLTLVRGAMHGLLSLLFFSNVVIALGVIFSSQELSLLLYTPVSRSSLYFAKLIETAVTGSWMVLIIALPAGAGLLGTSPVSLFAATVGIVALVPFLVIPAALGMTIVCIIASTIPPYRLRDALVVVAFLLCCGAFYFGRHSSFDVPLEREHLDEIISALSHKAGMNLAYLPSTWLADVLSIVSIGQAGWELPLIKLFLGAIASISVSLITFRLLLDRGLNVAAQTIKHGKIYPSSLGTLCSRVIIPFNDQLRAVAIKEFRMFIRDTTQAIQLLMLLLLTFMYLYNFRALEVGAQVAHDNSPLWHLALTLANICFGSCIVAAIATRFVYPAISLEGRAYPILRAAPMTVHQLLKYKYLSWLIPISIVSIVLLLSGAVAIDCELPFLIATALVALSLSSGIVGLGIGVGAVFAKFDWDSPAQVTASFGSLIFMVLAVTLIGVTTIPASALFILLSDAHRSPEYPPFMYNCATVASIFFVVATNVFASQRALSAGETALRELS